MIEHSVIIPTFNGTKYLSLTVESIIKQSLDKSKYEILIIDNASTDKTKELSHSLIKKYPKFNIRYIYEPIPGLLSGRHRGTIEANSEILTFIDDDIIADVNWLSAIAVSFSNSSIQIVGGKNLPKYEINPPKWVENLWKDSPYGGKWLGYLSLLDFGNKNMKISPLYVWGLNFSIRKKTLLDCGGFNPDTYPKYLQKYQGDGETGLSYKLIENGILAEYQPKAIVHHIIPKERLTIDFFNKRIYFQGVCDSYTHIREYFKSSNDLNNYFAKKPINNRILSLAKTMYQDIIFFCSEKRPHDIRKMEKTFNKSYQKGFSFHQNEVKKEPGLIDWINKPDYWDYSLPEIEKSNRISVSQKTY
jgi:glucosyl-dolichyl phosphate glucuronosyltransferase